jgi:hypothetical protein
MLLSSRITTALRLAAASIFLFVFVTSSAEAKQKLSAAEKRPGYSAAKHKSATAAKRKIAKRDALKHKSATAAKRKIAKGDAAKRKLSVAAKQVPVTATPGAPLNKEDCIEAAQGFYARAQTISRQKNQLIPQEFQLVISKMDELCGKEEFEKARISMDWMNLCLQKFTKDSCSRDKSYFCAIDPKSKECLSQSETQGKSSNSR